MSKPNLPYLLPRCSCAARDRVMISCTKCLDVLQKQKNPHVNDSCYKNVLTTHLTTGITTTRGTALKRKSGKGRHVGYYDVRWHYVMTLRTYVLSATEVTYPQHHRRLLSRHRLCLLISSYQRFLLILLNKQKLGSIPHILSIYNSNT